ncbi:hypothetical protein E2C01_093209 [Portunus trituberculatus]|uniref:Uncharacterized protein n=1 Tax=Portunus trituberculatus TaxID=210409 RepID=A0A5B7JIF5_PORTR|nr:hypothetical protein [Portunus trituberculatus]
MERSGGRGRRCDCAPPQEVTHMPPSHITWWTGRVWCCGCPHAGIVLTLEWPQVSLQLATQHAKLLTD